MRKAEKGIFKRIICNNNNHKKRKCGEKCVSAPSFSVNCSHKNQLMPENVLPFQPSMQAAVASLRERFPQAPFLTLGQTVLWDEPVKAAFCRALEVLAPEATIVAAVHDTDYFAKLSLSDSPVEDSGEKFVLLEHNDGDTRDLWSAAGEISTLLGSETVPTRHKLSENGVAIDRVARSYPGGLKELLNTETAAWGWRALVHTEAGSLLAGEVRLRDIAPKLLEQIRWAFDESLKALGTTLEKDDDHVGECQCPAPCESREVAARVLRWVEEYCAAEPDATLSELYRYLTPRLWGMIRNGGSCNLQTSHSLKIFRFNRQACTLPRFSFVDLFLNPATREAAKTAYNDAVRGSGIYTLDQFGTGALPFDVVIPGKGRGTLRVRENLVVIETNPPIVLKTEGLCENVAELAAILEEKFGEDVVLVGKAVSLISMLAREMIFVFHEKASAYTKLTQKMNASMRAAGIDLDLHPMLRLKYSTWDALAGVNTEFCLPPHLVRAFGKKVISASEFAARWEAVCQEQDALRENLKACRSPRELLNTLGREGEYWRNAAIEYSQAREIIAGVSERAKELQKQIEELRERKQAFTQNAIAVERKKGEAFRAEILPLREKIRDLHQEMAARTNPLDENGQPRKLSKAERAQNAELDRTAQEEVKTLRAVIAQMQPERARYDQEIAMWRSAAVRAREEARVLTSQRVEVEKSQEAQAARATIARWEYEAELERLRRVRDAIATSEGLRYTNLRPTAWWLPLVSPDGVWFEQLVATAQARVEEL